MSWTAKRVSELFLVTSILATLLDVIESGKRTSERSVVDLSHPHCLHG